MDTPSTQKSLSNVQTRVPHYETPHLNDVEKLGMYRYIKLALDIISSSCLLLLLSPVLAIIALLVRLDSVGPVIFRQTRVGKDGTDFTLYKFRTMVVDTPTLATDELIKSGQSYYTNLGLKLRKYSLDELPQLWNVLRGEMSLIGPRPSLRSQEWLNTRRQLYRVSDLRPGITGWAQVSGRDELSDNDKVAYDADYRARCSVMLDLRIAFLTVRAVFTGVGAN